VEVVRLLLARGADPNGVTQQGLSPLLLAASAGHAELASMLLQAGADPNTQDRFGRTALYEAAQRGDQVMAAVLLRHGADATLASRHGRDALQLAGHAGHEAVLETLRVSAPVARKLDTSSGHAAAQPRADAESGLGATVPTQR
jgi:ankyrin repeat protein